MSLKEKNYVEKWMGGFEQRESVNTESPRICVLKRDDFGSCLGGSCLGIFMDYQLVCIYSVC